MPKFAANISTMFQEHPFPERFHAAAAAGFSAVECTFAYEFPAKELAAARQANGLQHLLLNVPPGDLKKGERGFASLPGKKKEFQASFEQALEYAVALDCPNIHVMAGITQEEYSFEEHEATFIANLRQAAAQAEKLKKNLLIEAINTYDNPGYFFNKPAYGIALLEKIALPNVRLQFDFYHTQMMVGHLEYHFKQCLPYTAHVQISGMPRRQEPDDGEINYPYLLDLLDTLKYPGWVGLEYTPRGDTLQGLRWMARYK